MRDGGAAAGSGRVAGGLPRGPRRRTGSNYRAALRVCGVRSDRVTREGVFVRDIVRGRDSVQLRVRAYAFRVGAVCRSRGQFKVVLFNNWVLGVH